MRSTPALLMAVVVAASLAAGSAAQAAWPPFVVATATRTRTIATPTLTPTPSRTATSSPTRTPVPTNTPTIPALSDAFQLRYAANLSIGDSVINLTNAGTRAGTDPAGTVCANVYVFTPDETMIACCACPIPPNGLRSYSARNDLISASMAPGVPTSIVVKLLATAKTSAACDASSPTTTNLAPGLRAWGTTMHALPSTPVTYGVTETEFAQAALSGSELAQLSTTCASIEAAGGGVCTGCRIGGL